MNQVTTTKTHFHLFKFSFLIYLLIDETVIPDNSDNTVLHNPIKLIDLRTWITSKTFPEDQIRYEYDVSFHFFDNILF